MSFDLLERSLFGGRPIGLLRLSRTTLVKRYCTGAQAVTVAGDTYAPLAMGRSAIRETTERAKAQLTLTLPVDADVAAWWRPYPPSSRVGVTWLAKHTSDPEVVVEWMGRVIGHKFTDQHLILTCESLSTTARTRAQAVRWQRACPLALYSIGLGMCNVDKTAFAVPVTLSGATGAIVQSDDIATYNAANPGRAAGGFFAWTRDDGEPELRTIMAADGDTWTLNYGAEDLAAGLAATGYPGCKHTFEDCRDFFGNEANYGGAKYMPNKSPMDGLSRPV